MKNLLKAVSATLVAGVIGYSCTGTYEPSDDVKALRQAQVDKIQADIRLDSIKAAQDQAMIEAQIKSIEANIKEIEASTARKDAQATADIARLEKERLLLDAQIKAMEVSNQDKELDLEIAAHNFRIKQITDSISMVKANNELEIDLLDQQIKISEKNQSIAQNKLALLKLEAMVASYDTTGFESDAAIVAELATQFNKLGATRGELNTIINSLESKNNQIAAQTENLYTVNKVNLFLSNGDTIFSGSYENTFFNSLNTIASNFSVNTTNLSSLRSSMGSSGINTSTKAIAKMYPMISTYYQTMQTEFLNLFKEYNPIERKRNNGDVVEAADYSSFSSIDRKMKETNNMITNKKLELDALASLKGYAANTGNFMTYNDNEADLINTDSVSKTTYTYYSFTYHLRSSSDPTDRSFTSRNRFTDGSHTSNNELSNSFYDYLRFGTAADDFTSVYEKFMYNFNNYYAEALVEVGEIKTEVTAKKAEEEKILGSLQSEYDVKFATYEEMVKNYNELLKKYNQ